jgi:hypothetical protein
LYVMKWTIFCGGHPNWQKGTHFYGGEVEGG